MANRFPGRDQQTALLAIAVALLASAGVAAANGDPEKPKTGNPAPIAEIGVNTPCLVISAVGRRGRSPYHTDAIEAQLVAGSWRPPIIGAEVTLPDNAHRTWQKGSVSKDGVLSMPGGGYAYLAVTAKQSGCMILEASGHGMVHVNGEPRAGDPYGYGYLRLPVWLHEGVNDFLFQAGRGDVHARLVAPAASKRSKPRTAQLQFVDLTVPDLVIHKPCTSWLGMLVENLTPETLPGLSLSISWPGVPETAKTYSLPPLLPLQMRKFGFLLDGPAQAKAGPVALTTALLDPAGDTLDSGNVTLQVVQPERPRRATFVSQIDGSVQYYAHVPAKAETGGSTPGLVVSLHGASVEASGQAACYAPKPWAHVVAPTNRRPFGFDWEDWGRLDALEVTELVQKQLGTDPARTYLTGHSMGGHGVWHLGVTYPDRFAALGASAGWISMGSYAGARGSENGDPILSMCVRAVSGSDTLALKRNLKQEGVYILHGDKDDNVPVSEARTMRAQLGAFHPDFAYHEQPGAGHWWGNPCVDWPPLMEFLARHRLPENSEIQDIDFTTASPGISARDHWLVVETQEHPFQPSNVKAHADLKTSTFELSTTNVLGLAIDLQRFNTGNSLTVKIDGQKLPDSPWPAEGNQVFFLRGSAGWQRSPKPAPELKRPERAGTLKDAFRHHVQFVYGTRGTAAENAWALAKARFDAETFWYRGNASIDIIPDHDFKPAAEPDRSVILYGNADGNGAWESLLQDSPVEVRRNCVRLGTRTAKGPDLACLFIRPRLGSAMASIGVIAGTGLPGMRLTNQLPIFLSGVGYPDFTLIHSNMLELGAAGIRAAGFFGPDWSVDSGEFAWR
jgi:pimeloyl-ACP methyl ester carboxylesterase